ncbi:hypothetical protein D9756_010737 [Leucocoprinus leucothites]|uniref:JmjC domain-containing protein n=1 Tax=Leucocoprinus leucothites TaxID=201217 RepID=A0A8H5CUI2_9AGAR|nr:hypothetical protein D9756_010737 [Leucoagaricus leucothites]
MLFFSLSTPSRIPSVPAMLDLPPRFCKFSSKLNNNKQLCSFNALPAPVCCIVGSRVPTANPHDNHRSGCEGAVLTPLCMKWNLSSYNLSNVVPTSPPGGYQNNSAENVEFLHTLDDNEQRCLSLNHEFRAFVGLPQWEEPSTAADRRANALKALFAYRVADTLAFAFGTDVKLNENKIRYPSKTMASLLQGNRSRPRSSLFGGDEFNWDVLLQRARYATNGRGRSSFQGQVPPMAKMSDLESMFKYVVASTQDTLQSVITTNFIAAACYISFVIKSGFLYLPDSAEATLEALNISSSQVSIDGLQPHFSLARAAYVAVGASPVLLLAPINWCLNLMYATDLTRAWFLSHVAKAPALVDAEKSVLRAVYAICFDQKSPTEALEEMWKSIPEGNGFGSTLQEHLKYEEAAACWRQAEESSVIVANKASESILAINAREEEEEGEEEGMMVEKENQHQDTEMTGVEDIDTFEDDSHAVKEAPEPELEDVGMQDACTGPLQADPVAEPRKQSLRKRPAPSQSDNVPEKRMRAGKTASIINNNPATKKSLDARRKQMLKKPEKEIVFSIPYEPIYLPITLVAEAPSKSYEPPRSLILHDVVSGQVEREWTAKCHLRKQAMWYQKLADHLRDEIPVPTSGNDILRIMTRQEFADTPLWELNHIFRKQNILVYSPSGSSARVVQFNEALFEEILPGFSWKTLEVHDYSISLGLRQGYESRMGYIDVPGLVAAANNKEGGKIINALDIPNTTGAFALGPNPISSSKHAWVATQNKPAPRLAWYLAATEGAYSDWHIDSDGLATRIEVLVGEKYWILGDFKDTMVSNTDSFAALAHDDLNTEILNMTPVLLKPGMTLYMRPCTPHLVATPASAVCSGDQFYASSSIRDTCFGILHGFAAGRSITNVNHAETSHDLLRGILNLLLLENPFIKGKRQLDYRLHLPDLLTSDGIMDAFHLCSIMFLGSAIFSAAYVTPSLHLSEAMRDKLMHGRDLSHRAVFRIVTNSCASINGTPVDNMWTDVYYTLVSFHAVALHGYLNHKTLHAEHEGISAHKFNTKIKILARENPEFGTALNKVKASGHGTKSFEWQGGEIMFSFADPMGFSTDLPAAGAHGYSDLEWHHKSAYSRALL